MQIICLTTNPTSFLLSRVPLYFTETVSSVKWEKHYVAPSGQVKWECGGGTVDPATVVVPGGTSPHHRAKRGSTELWGSHWMVGELARSSCFHNHRTAISRAGKHSTSTVPGTRTHVRARAHTHTQTLMHIHGKAMGTAAFWDLQSPEATEGPGTCSRLQCMLGFVVPTVFPLGLSFSKGCPLPPTAVPN